MGLVLKVMADFLDHPGHFFIEELTDNLLTMNKQRMLHYAPLSCDHHGDTTV